MEEGSLSAFDCGLGRAQEETVREMEWSVLATNGRDMWMYSVITLAFHFVRLLLKYHEMMLPSVL